MLRELLPYRQQQVCQAVHLLSVYLSSRVVRGSLAFDLDLGRAPPGQEIEARGSRVIHKVHIPALLHEVGCDVDFIGERARTIRAAYGVAQPSLEGGLGYRRQSRVNPMRWDKEPVERVVFLAFRQPAGVLAIFARLGQGEL